MPPGLKARYPGAQSFSDETLSKDLFFGREAECRKLVNQVIANRLVVVYARSGLGKTSLLKAGIAEDLRAEGFLPLMVRVNDIEGGPFKSVLLDIQSETVRQGVEYIAGSSDSLWHFFKTAEFWRGDRLLTPVLILDQFEELFTLHEHGLRDAFLQELGAAIRGVPPSHPVRLPIGDGQLRASGVASSTEPQLRVVIATREDYLGYLDEGVEQIPHILHQRLRLTPLSLDDARQAIEKPAALDHPDLRVRPFEYADNTVTAILDFLAKRSTSNVTGASPSVDPFQLQLVCQQAERLAEERDRFEGTVSIALQDFGGELGLHRVLTGFYLRLLNGIARRRSRRGVRSLCERILISADGHRLSVDEGEILRVTKIERPLLERLVDERLLRSDRRADKVYYELSHDTLVEPILSTRRGTQRLVGGTLNAAGCISSIFGVMFLVMSVFLPVSDLVSGDSFYASLVPAGVYALLGLALLVGGRKTRQSGHDLMRRYRTARRLRRGKSGSPRTPATV